MSAIQASRELDSWKMGSDGVAKKIGTRRDRNTYVIGGKILDGIFVMGRNRW